MSKIDQPLLVICFGVSGCGKSTLAENISEEFSFEYIEADDFHSANNKAHMAAGKPLTDEMREPWIQLLTKYLTAKKQQGIHCVMANSCLRSAHRERFRILGFNTVFMYLKGSKNLITNRMNARTEHFMPSSLLDSQFDALEDPSKEVDVRIIDISKTIKEISTQANTFIKSKLT